MKTSLTGDRAFFSGVARLGIPVALQSLLASSASMVDTIMLGSQGELAVAAIGICAQYTMLLFSAFFGFCHGGSIFIAQYWGAKDEHGICKAYGLMQSWMVFFGLLFGVVAILAPEFIMGVYTDKVAIQQVALPYLRIVGFSLPLQVLSFAVSSLMRSTEQVRPPLYASIAALLTNVVINWLLIYGRFGLPKLGVTGAAIGTLASSIVNIGMLFAYCLKDRGGFAMRVREHYGWSFTFIKQFFQKSVFIVFNEIGAGVANMMINMILGRQDESAIAAIAVFRVLESFIFTFFKGLTNASAVMVGKQVGAGAHLEGYTDAKRFALLVPVCTFAVCLVILPFRAPLIGLFGLGEQAMRYCAGMLLIYTVTGTIRSCNWICNDCFRAGGDSMYGTLLELGCTFFLSIPALAVGGLVLRLPFLAVFALIYVDDFARIIQMLRRVNSGRWVKPVTQEGQATLPEFRRLMGIEPKGR